MAYARNKDIVGNTTLLRLIHTIYSPGSWYEFGTQRTQITIVIWNQTQGGGEEEGKERCEISPPEPHFEECLFLAER